MTLQEDMVWCGWGLALPLQLATHVVYTQEVIPVKYMDKKPRYVFQPSEKFFVGGPKVCEIMSVQSLS